jgi:hypothetical protein
MIYLIPCVMAAAFLAACAAYCRLTRPRRVPLAQLANPEPMPGEQLAAFPVDTGPLLLLSEKAAANDALEIEIAAMSDAAEREIGPVQ